MKFKRRAYIVIWSRSGFVVQWVAPVNWIHLAIQSQNHYFCSSASDSPVGHMNNWARLHCFLSVLESEYLFYSNNAI